MRLINVETLCLETVYSPEYPYVVLSHTWGRDEDELTFQEMLNLEGNMSGTTMTRASKIVRCCAQAKMDGYKYVWIDTCCIDKSNSVELYEAINSMYRWYDGAAMCYAYIADMAPGDPVNKLATCRWFERGWTLQELLASKKINFFDSNWNCLGSKRSLSSILESATGIPAPFLAGVASVLNEASIAQRMSWASNRQTTRPEDGAYCLLGIFDVMIPLIYGEGAEAAFLRLQEAIMKKDSDDSILSWALYPPYQELDEATRKEIPGGALASSPHAFRHCGDVVRRNDRSTVIKAFEIFGGSMPITLRLHEGAKKELYGVLGCGPENELSKVVAIPLQRIWTSSSSGSQLSITGPEHEEYVRPYGRPAILVFKPSMNNGAPKSIHVKTERLRSTETTLNRRHWIYLQEPYPKDLELHDVRPREAWIKDNAMIRTRSNERPETTLFLARFRATTENCPDLVVGIKFVQQKPGVAKSPGDKEEKPIVQGNLSRCSRSTSMDDVVRSYRHLTAAQWGVAHTRSGSLNLIVDVVAQSVASQEMFVVRWAVTDKEPAEIIDLTVVGEVMKKRIELLDLMVQETSTTSQSEGTKGRLESAKKSLALVEERLGKVELALKTLWAEKSSLEADRSEAKSRVEGCLALEQEASSRATSLLQRQRRIKDDIHRLLSGPGASISDGSVAAIETDDQILFTAVVESMRRYSESTGIPSAVEEQPPKPLTWASSAGHLPIVSMLLGMREKFPSLGEELPAALIAGARSGQVEVVRLLSDAGVDIKPGEEDETTNSLFQAAGKHPGLSRFLVKRYCTAINSESTRKELLFWAAKKGYFSVVRAMLESGVSAMAVEQGRPVLHSAVENGHAAVVRELLEFVSAETKKMNPPEIIYANKHNTGLGPPAPPAPISLFKAGGSTSPITKLLEARDRVYGRSGTTALQVAIYKNHFSICQLLLDAGADPNASSHVSIQRNLPLILAIEHNHFEIARLLLNRGADPNGNQFCTLPLAVACKHTSPEFAYLLIMKGASPDMKQYVVYQQMGGFMSRSLKFKNDSLIGYAKEFGRSWALDLLKRMAGLDSGRQRAEAEYWLTIKGFFKSRDEQATPGTDRLEAYHTPHEYSNPGARRLERDSALLPSSLPYMQGVPVRLDTSPGYHQPPQSFESVKFRKSEETLKEGTAL